jgi:hypothetical protein
VRNIKLPVTDVEVKSGNHADWYALSRGTDGTLTDAGGFGDGAFTLRATSLDGQRLEDTFDAVDPGAVLSGRSQFE